MSLCTIIDRESGEIRQCDVQSIPEGWDALRPGRDTHLAKIEALAESARPVPRGNCGSWAVLEGAIREVLDDYAGGDIDPSEALVLIDMYMGALTRKQELLNGPFWQLVEPAEFGAGAPSLEGRAYNPVHTQDEECDVDPVTKVCRTEGCGVEHDGEPCTTCGGVAFHKSGCQWVVRAARLLEEVTEGSHQ